MVRYMPKKWRTSHMELVSEIFLRVRVDLCDDWMDACLEGDVDYDHYLDVDNDTRRRCALFNETKYQLAEGTASADSMLAHHDMLADLLDVDVELESDFLANYESWIEKDVFGKLARFANPDMIEGKTLM